MAINYGIRGEGGKAGKAAYRAVSKTYLFKFVLYKECI
jgi:hypothetical protein